MHLDVHTLGVEAKREVAGVAISTLLVLPAGSTADVVVAGATCANTATAATAALTGAAASFGGVGFLAGAEWKTRKYVFVGGEGRDGGCGVGGRCVGTQALGGLVGLVGFYVAFEIAEGGVVVASVDGGAASGFAAAVAGSIGGDWFKIHAVHAALKTVERNVFVFRGTEGRAGERGSTRTGRWRSVEGGFPRLARLVTTAISGVSIDSRGCGSCVADLRTLF